MTHTIETLLVVPAVKVKRLRQVARERGDGDSTLVIYPGHYVASHIPRFILLDVDLKHEWGFGVDQWFHEILLQRVHPTATESVMWVKEDNNAKA